MRRYEIDWIRNISILMLFIYHTCAIFCVFGDFYIISEQKNLVANLFIVLMYVWYMPMLFFLAGASTYFASKKRSFKEYMKERVEKLFIPLLFGLLFWVPPQTYMARLWRGESNLNYFQHLKYFFTNLTDFTGYDGAFSPAHLWFILYLFIVSMIGGIVIFKLFSSKKGLEVISLFKSIILNKFSFFALLSLGLISDIFPAIMGKSIVGCLIIFIFGAVIYSDEDILNKMMKNRFRFLFVLLATSIIGVVYIFLFRDSLSPIMMWFGDALLKNIVLISAVSCITSFASLYISKSNDVLKYLNKSSFAVYIIHQPILLALAFFIVPVVKSTTLAMIFIILTSAVVTFAVVECVRRLKIFNVVFALK